METSLRIDRRVPIQNIVRDVYNLSQEWNKLPINFKRAAITRLGMDYFRLAAVLEAVPPEMVEAIEMLTRLREELVEAN